ncbi:hypothetical protein ACTFIZ_009810 [Dictyostelium cf. discoideum]
MTTKIVTQSQTQTPMKPPRLIDLSVSCCSSESEFNKSSNVLLDDTYRIWQTKDKTGKAFIELQFPIPSLIHQIDITNAGSAFIEVLVGLVTWEPTEFLVLVPLTNFMSLSETTNKTNRNRMKSFDTSNFSSQTVPRKWERVRIVCSQPWLDDNLGISLVKIYAPPSKITTPPTTTKLSLSSSSNNNLTPQIKSEKLGDSANDIDLTDTSASNLIDTSFESDPNIPLKSDKTQMLNFVPELKRSNSSTPKKLSKSATVMLSNPLPGQVLVINQKSKSKGVNKEPEKEIETEEEDEDEKIEIKKKLDQQQKKQSSQESSSQQKIPQKQKSKLVEPKQSDEDDSMQDIKIVNNNNNNVKNENQTKSTQRNSLEKLTNTNDGETDEECDDLQIIATPKQQQKLTPFGNLLKGVVLVIGGIQNPQRGEIREKALEMGAGYKPDWCREATHLVTPFKGTDKFKIAQKSGGSIIKPKWIEDCYKLKSRLPIKNYTFQDDDSDSDQDDIAEKIASAKKAKKTISTDSTSKKRKKKGAPGSDDSDDDSHIPNVYDYNDGFIDNSFSSSEASDDKEKDPDHLDDHVHENVDDLLNDGLDYLKRTYGYKPDRDLIQHNPYHKKQKNHHSSDNNNYKSSPSYKPNKYYNEEYDNNNNNNNNSSSSSSSSSKNKTNNNNNDEFELSSTATKNKDKKEKEEKISYKPKQQKLEEFDDDSLFDNHDTVLMTPEQIKEEIDRLVNNYNNGNDNENNENSNNKNNNNNSNKNNKSTINGPTSPNKSTTDDYLEGNNKKLSPSRQQSSQSITNKNQLKDSIIPEKCSTQLPKNNPHDFKGKEYILNPLPSFFEGFEFYLSVKDEALRKNIVRLITAYKGSISSIPTNSTKFIITDKTVWDRLFDITKQKYPNILFLSPSFIMQSHNYQKLSPIDKHLILKSK